MPDFGNNEADGDIRYVTDGSPRSERHVRYVELARPHVFPVCSASTAERLRSKLKTAADLLTAPLIEEGGAEEWRLWFERQGITETPRSRVGRYGHAHLALAAARAGQGVALGNHYLVSEDVAAGRLIVLATTDRPLKPVQLGAYMLRGQASMWSDPVIVSFRNWLTREFQRDTPS
jgi:DNA-binding transcriptional LysR family regulator